MSALLLSKLISVLEAGDENLPPPDQSEKASNSRGCSTFGLHDDVFVSQLQSSSNPIH